MKLGSSGQIALAASILCALCRFAVAGSLNAAAAHPSVFFWHFALVLDHSSYQALRESPAVAALAGTEFRHTQTNSNSYSGFYLYGRQTFMEFAEEDATNPVGDSVLGLIVERRGELAAVAQSLHSKFGADFEIQSMVASAGKVPWYKAIAFDLEDEFHFGSFIQETEPGYLASIHPGARIERPLSREVYESWRYHSERPLQDVTKIRVAIRSSRELSRLSTYFEVLGWQVRSSKGGFVAVGPNIDLSVLLADGREGIREVEFELNRPASEQMLQLGHIKLNLHGTAGRFSFW